MFNIFSLSKKIRYAVRSSQWTKVRKQHLEENPSCAACGKRVKLEVHHKKPVHIHPELELDPSNLITLCADPCHIIFGHFMDWKSWNINVEKECKVYYNKLIKRPKKE